MSGSFQQWLWGAAEPSLRNLVESYAQEAGMEFLPKARQHEGLQVIVAALRACVLRDQAPHDRYHYVMQKTCL